MLGPVTFTSVAWDAQTFITLSYVYVPSLEKLCAARLETQNLGLQLMIIFIVD